MKRIAHLLAVTLCMASANAQDQKIFPLTPDDLALQVRQRAVVEKFLSSEDLRERYPSPAGKLGALRALLKGKVFSATQTYELQAMGIVLGDVFVQDMGFKWVIVQDSVGRDFALQYKDSSVFLFPLTMISKRVEQGEDVDVFDLYNGIAAEASAQLQTAGYAKP